MTKPDFKGLAAKFNKGLYQTPDRALRNKTYTPKAERISALPTRSRKVPRTTRLSRKTSGRTADRRLRN